MYRKLQHNKDALGEVQRVVSLLDKLQVRKEYRLAGLLFTASGVDEDLVQFDTERRCFSAFQRYCAASSGGAAAQRVIPVAQQLHGRRFRCS